MAKQSDRRGATAPPPRQVAELVLEVTLLVTRLVTPQVRLLRPKRLSLSHIRALGFLDADPDATLSAVAEYVGLTPPTTSTLVDALARRGLVVRRAATHDRRCVQLRLTEAGRGALRTALAAARSALDARFAGLSPSDRALVARAMARLRPFLTRGK
jgi:DNA-binding MarR family transcriptional regulator